MVQQKVIDTQFVLAQKHVYIHGLLKKSPKRAWDEYWYPKGTLKILGKNLIFFTILVVGLLWVCRLGARTPFKPFF